MNKQKKVFLLFFFSFLAVSISCTSLKAENYRSEITASGYTAAAADGNSLKKKNRAAKPQRKKPSTTKKRPNLPPKQTKFKNSKVQKKTSNKKKPVSPTAAYKGAIVYDINSGQHLFANQANRQIAPASLTKILSMYVALDTMRTKKISPETLTRVSRKAGSTGGSRMGLKPGDVVSLNALLSGMAISSGNDASVAIAEFISGSELEFVKIMNRKAQEIGMKQSRFQNASGLPAKNQYTTPSDMLILARSYLRAYPQNLAKYHNQKTYNHNGITTRNTNPLIGKYFGVDGLKTGYVNASGFNLIATAKRGTQRVIAVLMGCPSVAVRTREMTKLLDNAFGTTSPTPQKPTVGSQKTKQKKTSRRIHQTEKEGPY